MSETSIRSARRAERSRALNIQLLAFATDPVMRWLWPEPDAYLSNFRALLDAFGGRAFDLDAAHVSEDFRGGALWLPPNVAPDDEAMEAVANDTVAASIRDELLEIFEQMDASLPAEPHWHLAFVGVDPFWHGNGIGAALLNHALEQVDAEGATAYLESTNARNVTLYQRHGFEVTREIRVGSAPPLFPMVRAARMRHDLLAPPGRGGDQANGRAEN